MTGNFIIFPVKEKAASIMAGAWILAMLAIAIGSPLARASSLSVSLIEPEPGNPNFKLTTDITNADYNSCIPSVDEGGANCWWFAIVAVSRSPCTDEELPTIYDQLITTKPDVFVEANFSLPSPNPGAPFWICSFARTTGPVTHLVGSMFYKPPVVRSEVSAKGLVEGKGGCTLYINSAPETGNEYEYVDGKYLLEGTITISSTILRHKHRIGHLKSKTERVFQIPQTALYQEYGAAFSGRHYGGSTIVFQVRYSGISNDKGALGFLPSSATLTWHVPSAC